MIALKDIKLYKGADRTFVFVFEEAGVAHLLPGVNTLRIYLKPESTPFLELAISLVIDEYHAEITNAQSALLKAIEYFYEFRNVDTATIFPVKGKLAVTDVFTSNKITRVGTIEYDSTTKYYK